MADLRDMQIEDGLIMDASSLGGQTLDMFGDDVRIDLDMIGSPFQGPPGKPGTNGADGREVEIAVHDDMIQWRYAGDEDWTDLVPLSAITGPQGDKGDAGDDGLSAYGVWLAEGNTGTVDDYLFSLIGPKGDKGDPGEGFTDVPGAGNFARAMGAWVELSDTAFWPVGTNAGTLVEGNDFRLVNALQPGAIGTTVQPYSSNLTAYANGDTPSNFTLSIMDSANVAAWQAALYLVPGTNVQAQSTRLSALQNAMWAADQMIYLTGTNTVGTTSLTAAARGFLGSPDEAAMRSYLQLGDAAQKNTGATTGTVAAGDDTRIVNALQPTAIGVTIQGYSANLQSLSTQASTAFGRSLLNTASYAALASGLGLGGAAYLNVGTAVGTVAAGNDSRIVNAVNRTGDTMTGPFTLNADPTANLHAATKQYVDTMVSGALRFKDSIDCSTNPNYPAAAVGDSYIVSAAGRIGGAAGKIVDQGDMVVCRLATVAGNEAAVGANWFVLEHNLQGALLAANNLGDILDAAVARTNLGLVIGTNVQAYNAKLQAISALTMAANQIMYFTGASTVAATSLTAVGRTFLAASTVAAQQAALSLTPGTNIQAQNANLQAIAGLTTAADKMTYWTGAGTAAATDLTAQARTFLAAGTQALQRSALGLGTASTYDIGTSGGTVPLFNGINQWGGSQAFGAISISASSANLLPATRTGSTINAVGSFTNDSGTIYYGNADGSTFAVGNNANLFSSVNQWIAVTATMTTVKGLTTSNAQITGGTIAGITDLAVADGGTGVSSLTAGYVKADGANPFSSVATIPVGDISGLGTMATQSAANFIPISGTNLLAGGLVPVNNGIIPLGSVNNKYSSVFAVSGNFETLNIERESPSTATFDSVGTRYSDTGIAAAGWNAIGRRARGTKAAPTAVLANDVLTGMYGAGWNSFGTPGFSVAMAAIRFLTEEDWTGAGMGTYIDLGVTQAGASTRSTRLQLRYNTLRPVTTNTVALGESNFVYSAAYVADDPYAPTWDGSVAVPTKNAVYDKIEAMLSEQANKDGFRFDSLQAPSGLTSFARTTTAKYRDSSGVLQDAASGVPRFTYRWNGTAWVPGGLMMEGASTNISLYSDNPNNAYWSKSAVTVTEGSGPAFNGSTNMALFTTTGTMIYRQLNTLNVTNGGTYTVSFYVKGGPVGSPIPWLRMGVMADGNALNGQQIWFNPNTGAIGGSSTTGTGWTLVGSTSTDLGNGIYRISITVITGANTMLIRLVGAANNNSVTTAPIGSTFYMIGVQVEEGTKATSYMMSAGVMGMRSAETANLDWSRSRYKPNGSMTLRYTFGDGTTQTVVTTASAGITALPNNLTSASIKYVADMTPLA